MGHKILFSVFQTGLLLSLLHNVRSKDLDLRRLVSEECRYPESTTECIKGAVCKPCISSNQAHCSQKQVDRKVKVCTCVDPNYPESISLPALDNRTCWPDLKNKTIIYCRNNLDCFGTEGVCVYDPLEPGSDKSHCYCHKDLIVPVNKLECVSKGMLLRGFVCTHNTDCSEDIGSSYCVQPEGEELRHCMCDDPYALISADRKICYPPSNKTNETCVVDSDCPKQLFCALNSSPSNIEVMAGVCIVLPNTPGMQQPPSVGSFVQPLAFFLLCVFTLLTV